MAEEKGKKMIGSYDVKVPEDTDVTLGYDMTANKVKNFKFSGIWTWIISKLKGESISDLNTTNKTVVGAIKEVNTPTFTPATSRANINSGESQSIIMGKIKKWLADLGTAAFCSVVNNLTTTAEGSVLDARQGKNLSDALKKLNTLMGNTDISSIGGGTLTGAINELNSKALMHNKVYSTNYDMRDSETIEIDLGGTADNAAEILLMDKYRMILVHAYSKDGKTIAEIFTKTIYGDNVTPATNNTIISIHIGIWTSGTVIMSYSKKLPSFSIK